MCKLKQWCRANNLSINFNGEDSDLSSDSEEATSPQQKTQKAAWR